MSTVLQRFFFSLCLAAISLPLAADTVVRYPRPQSEKDIRHIYRVKLLELALEKTAAEYGRCRIVYSAETMPQSRAVMELRGGRGVDVIALPSSKQRELELRPVRIPILKGLLGYRLLIIRSEDRQKYAKVRTVGDLAALNAGLGHDWLDRGIMESNGMKVVTSVEYEKLFQMLVMKRFDYFPRGVNEAFVELEDRKGTAAGLEIERTLAIHYVFPVYFFVAGNNAALAQRIEKGLRAALADGSFGRLFDSYNGGFVRKASLGRRRIIELANPLLPVSVPLDDARLWVKP